MKRNDTGLLRLSREGTKPAAWTGTARSGREAVSNVMGPDGKIRVRISRDILMEAARQTGKKPAQ